jgi:hypothetical protein
MLPGSLADRYDGHQRPGRGHHFLALCPHFAICEHDNDLRGSGFSPDGVSCPGDARRSLATVQPVFLPMG